MLTVTRPLSCCPRQGPVPAPPGTCPTREQVRPGCEASHSRPRLPATARPSRTTGSPRAPAPAAPPAPPLLRPRPCQPQDSSRAPPPWAVLPPPLLCSPHPPPPAEEVPPSLYLLASLSREDQPPARPGPVSRLNGSLPPALARAAPRSHLGPPSCPCPSFTLGGPHRAQAVSPSSHLQLFSERPLLRVNPFGREPGLTSSEGP